jgi:hypothetical protein
MFAGMREVRLTVKTVLAVTGEDVAALFQRTSKRNPLANLTKRKLNIGLPCFVRDVYVAEVNTDEEQGQASDVLRPEPV